MLVRQQIVVWTDAKWWYEQLYAESQHKPTLSSGKSDVQVGPQWRQIMVTAVAVSTINILLQLLAIGARVGRLVEDPMNPTPAL